MKPRPVQEVRKGKTEQARQLQGEAMLKALSGKNIAPALADMLYDNPFAIQEMGAGRLKITKTLDGQDHVEYNPPVSIQDLSPSRFPKLKE